jgi:hypothetical protein
MAFMIETMSKDGIPKEQLFNLAYNAVKTKRPCIGPNLDRQLFNYCESMSDQ